MKKRAISPLIATVILVGFTVALGAIVSTYLIKQAKGFNPESFVEESPYCESIVLEPVEVGVPQGVNGREPWPFSTVIPPDYNENDLYRQQLDECGTGTDENGVPRTIDSSTVCLICSFIISMVLLL